MGHPPHPIRGETIRRTLLAAAACSLLSACGSSDDAWSGVYDDKPAAEPAARAEDPKDVLAQAALDLEAAFAARQNPPEATPAPDPTPGPFPPVPEAPAEEPVSQQATGDVVAAETPEPEPLEETPPPPPPDPDVVIADLAGRIAQIIGNDLHIEQEPLRHAARLLALDLISPGAAGPELRSLEEAMLPPQQEALDALRGLFRELADSSTLDQVRLADLLLRQAHALPRGRPLTIAETRLCSEVDGFGRYTPMPATFAAGQTHAALVYVEIENFKERRFDSAKDGWAGLKDPTAERWVAQLGQELALLDDRNDHVALHEPEEVIRDVARRRRRDFYTIQRIDLPAQLAIGRYHLKVTVRDLVDGEAVAEKIIPIEIVPR